MQELKNKCTALLTQACPCRIFWRTRGIFNMTYISRNRLEYVNKTNNHIFFKLFNHISNFEKMKIIFFSIFQNQTNDHISRSTRETTTQTQFDLYKKIKGPLEKSSGELLELKCYQRTPNNLYTYNTYRFSGKWLFWSLSDF